MKYLMSFAGTLAIVLAAQAAFGQGSLPIDANNPPPEHVRRMDENRERWDRLNGRNSRGMIANRERLDRRPSPRTKPDGKPYSKEELAQMEALKMPSEADRARYAEFLLQSNTGMFRLFPFLPCVEKNLIRVDAECADFLPDSWSYSFRTKGYAFVRDHSYLYHYDLKLKDGELSTGALLSLGVLTSLGEVPIEKVSLSSDGIKYLAQLKPETAQTDSERQRDDFARGIEDGGFQYATKMKVAENTTYGLRVVAYRMPDDVKLYLKNENKITSPYRYPLNQFDERDDVIVAFRVIRKAENDALTIVWQELSRRKAPKLDFPKKVKEIVVQQNSR